MRGTAPAAGFQPTPPRGGRLADLFVLDQRVEVSTHAPAWGATVVHHLDGGDLLIVSTHAPAWGATRTAVAVQLRSDVFQPTPPRGGRPRTCPPTPAGCGRFNPRPRVGGDSGISPSAPTAPRFNPRPRVGGDLHPGGISRADLGVSTHAPAWGATRPRPCLCWWTITGFNPRPRVGGDALLDAPGGSALAFQPTPPRGGRRQQPW